MARLGSRLANKIKDQEDFERSQFIDEFTSKLRVFFTRINFDVDWSIESRDNDYTFEVGHSTKGKLDTATYNKEAWTEVRSK